MFASDRIEKLADWLRHSRFTCVLTGAGVSAESGLATFRGPDGLWKGRDPTEVATPEAFAADPREVWQFYNWRLRQAVKVQPNAGHFALAELQSMRAGFGLVTQNVDRLHQRAGESGGLFTVQPQAGIAGAARFNGVVPIRGVTQRLP